MFDRDAFRFTTKDEMVNIHGMFDPHTSPVSFDFEKHMKYLEENNFIFAKVRIAGESFQTIGDIKIDDGHYLSGVYTHMSGNSGYVLNLGDSAPDSYPYNDYFLYYYSDYTEFWKGCKELYGTYFE